MADAKKDDVKVKRSDLSVVAEDTNWRTYVQKVQQAEQDFYGNWGFLTKAAMGKLFVPCNWHKIYGRGLNDRH